MVSVMRKKFFRTSSMNPAAESSSSSPTDEGIMFSETHAPQKVDTKEGTEVADRPASEEVPNDEAQTGVKQAEAITLTWSKKSLTLAYALMWSLYCVNAFQSNITGNLSAFITSDFSGHSLLATIAVVTSVMAAGTYMPLAKVLNLWDRSTGFAIMVAFCLLGLILSACCNNIATYCAAQVFYSIGFAGLIFCVDVITIDTSTLRDRGLAYAFTSSPYIISAYGGPSAAERFHETNWRWGYGCFCIVLPAVALPMWLLLQYQLRKAKKEGRVQKREASGRTFMQSIWHYIIEFDILGVFLLTAGLVIFLLPFTIAGSDKGGWKQPHIIAMLVVGIVLLILFALAERFLAPVPFLPWELLANRTVLGACLIDVTYDIAYYCWNDYWTSYLMVVFGTSVSTAGYIASIFDVVSGVWLFAVGFLIRKTMRFRWLLFISVPLYLLGVGLMIYFRHPGAPLGYQIMCQVFIAFAGGTMIIVQQVAILAASDHNNAASALAFLNTFGNMGSAIGSSISGAIWTNTLPGGLKRLLPAAQKANWDTIYEDIDVQLSFPRGSATRLAIQQAYAESQRNMLIAGTAIMALSLGWMFLMRDIKLNKQQTKGVLF